VNKLDLTAKLLCGVFSAGMLIISAGLVSMYFDEFVKALKGKR